MTSVKSKSERKQREQQRLQALKVFAAGKPKLVRTK